MNDNALQTVSISDIEKMAMAVAASKLFGCKSKEEAMALMLVSQSEGVHPMTAVQEFHIIQGRPARKAESILARFQKAGGSVNWHTYSDTEVTGTFSHPQGGKVTVTWNLDRARAAGLADRDNYRKFPAPMFRSRCISEGVRTVYPGATGGMYTPEELEDLPPATTAKDMGPADVVGIQQPRSVSNVPPATAGSGAPISESPLRLIRAQLGKAEITEAECCKHFGIDKLESLTMDRVNAVFAWISNPGE